MDKREKKRKKQDYMKDQKKKNEVDEVSNRKTKIK